MMNLKNKNCLVIDYGGYISIAQRLSRNDGFDKVYYHVPLVHNGFPTHKPYDIGRNVEGIIKVDEWASVIEEVGLVCFFDVYEPALQEYFVSIGKAVVGSKFAGELEYDRVLLKNKIAELELPINKYWVAKGVGELDNILRQEPDVYVKSSHRGDSETWKSTNYLLSKGEINRLKTNLGAYANEETFVVEEHINSLAEVGVDTFCVMGDYPTENLSGVEIKDTGYYGKVVKYDSLPLQLRRVTDQFSSTFRELKYCNFHSNEVIIGEDRKGYLIDLTNRCFSSDTEILTDSGWKFFYDLDGSEKVCTLNPENRNIEYHKPYDYICNYYEGEMVLFTNSRNTINSLVTPNHAVWRTKRDGSGLFEQRADSLTDKGFIPRVGKWNAPDVEYFELPEYHHEWDFYGSNQKRNVANHFVCTKVKHEVAKKIKMDYWVAFLAWYLSEGAKGGFKNSKGIQSSVTIYQTKYPKELIDVLNNVGFKYTYYSNGRFQINSVQLCDYLMKYGLCDKKFVPDYIKNLSSRQIRIFLDNYILGDGSKDRGRYFSTSEKMIGDLQELVMKIGAVGNISKSKSGGKGTSMTVGGKTYIRKHDCYRLEEYFNRTDYWFETACRKDRYIKKESYKGFVYDVTVKNHLVYVRRNGKPLFSGNCPQPPSDLMSELFTNFPEIIWQIGNGITPQLEYKYSHGVQFIIKSELAKTDPSPIIVPDEYKDFVKIKNLTIDDDGVWYYTPLIDGMCEMGSVVGYGNSMREAVSMATKIADSLQGFDIKINTDCIEEVKEQISRLKNIGIHYLD